MQWFNHLRNAILCLNISGKWALCSITYFASGVLGAHSAAPGHILLRCRLHLCWRRQGICSAISLDVLRFLWNLPGCSDSPQLLRRLPPEAPMELDCAGENFTKPQAAHASASVSVTTSIVFCTPPVYLNSEPVLHGGHDCQLLRHRHRHHVGGHHSGGLLFCCPLLTTGRHNWLTFVYSRMYSEFILF